MGNGMGHCQLMPVWKPMELSLAGLGIVAHMMRTILNKMHTSGMSSTILTSIYIYI